MASSTTVNMMVATMFMGALLLLFSLYNTYGNLELMKFFPRRSLQVAQPSSMAPAPAPSVASNASTSSHPPAQAPSGASNAFPRPRSSTSSHPPAHPPAVHVVASNSSHNATHQHTSHNATHNVSSCPVDSLNVGLCFDVVAGLLNVTLGLPPNYPCCSIFFGFLDAEIAFCFCTTLPARAFGIDVNLPIRLSVLLNRCGKNPPPGFVCSSN